MKKTKIICSIGPASTNVEVMTKMVDNGMNVARINFSHATDEEKQAVLDTVNEVNKLRPNANVAVLFDTKGPDFRTGMMENGEITLKDNEFINIVKSDIVGTSEAFTVNYKETLDAITVGSHILLEDGLMTLEVVETIEDGLKCKILNGGVLGNRKGVAAPGVKLNYDFLSEQDKSDIEYAIKNNGDFLAASFVSSKEDIMSIKEIFKKHNATHIQLISKVESQTAIENIDEIIENSDGIMVARGDLGVEVPMHQLPVLQKMIVDKCRLAGKFCIVATEMLESMKKNARPTRAEVSDIANAVLDGTDAVMLSGETTIGKYPSEAVKFMADTCENVELHLDYYNQTDCISRHDITGIIARSVVDASNELGAKAILAATMSGYTARQISTLRPEALTVAGCTSSQVMKSLALNFGVYPVIVPPFERTDKVIDEIIENSEKIVKLEKDDVVVLTGGFHKNNQGNSTNLMKIHVI